MWPTISPPAVHRVAADALFASAVQRGDALSVSQIRQAITDAFAAYGDGGCVGRVAQEFGDHPETSAARMRWARSTVPGLDGQLVPAMRWMTAA